MEAQAAAAATVFEMRAPAAAARATDAARGAQAAQDADEGAPERNDTNI
jgi:hypothetical protein